MIIPSAQSSAVTCLVALLALFLVPRASGLEAAKTFTSLEQAINTAPAQDLKKLQTDSLAASALPALNWHYRKNVINCTAVIKCKAQLVTFSGDGSNGLRIRPYKILVVPRGNRKDLIGLPLFHFDATGAPPAPSTIVDGTIITVSGTISRCEIVPGPQGGLAINFELTKCKLISR